MMNRGIAAALVLALGSLVGMSGCGRSTDPWEGETGAPRVVVTIAPLHSFVKGVMGKRGTVKCLCTTTGPHHYQTDTRDARLLEKADAVFAVGLRLDETFIDALVKLARRKDLDFVKLGESLPRSMLRPMNHDEEDHDHKHAGHAHDHGSLDPHLWLGVPEAIKMVERIRDELSKVDPAHESEYHKNAADYIESLKKLQADGLKMLADKKVKRIISFHEALGYFARSYGLCIAGVIEPGAGDEPTSTHLARLVELCKKKDEPVGAIAVEPQYPKSTSAAIVKKELENAGFAIELATVDPLETAEPEELKQEGAAWYEARMRKNLKALADALK